MPSTTVFLPKHALPYDNLKSKARLNKYSAKLHYPTNKIKPLCNARVL